MVTIRPLTDDDWAAWWALRLRALAEHPDAFGQDHDEIVAEGEQPSHQRFSSGSTGLNRVFGAFDAASTLVGVAGITGRERRKQRHRMEIWGVYVAPESRGMGVGRRLLDACIGHARNVDGVRQVHIAAASHNGAAVDLYESCGFTRYGREPRALILPDGREVDEDLMVLMLDR